MKRLNGKVALITGSTSGIGEACAYLFAEEGARAIVHGRDGKRGQAVVQAIRAKGGKADYVEADLAKQAECDRLIAETMRLAGRLDILINNAGISIRAAAVDTTDAIWEQMMAVNVHAVFYLSRAAAKIMLAQGSGNIVNNASELGLIAEPGKFSYCVTKAAVVQMTRVMGLDLADKGIRVNAVCAGDTRTPLMENKLRARGFDLEPAVEAMALRTPLKRVATSEEIARAFLFLASDDSSFITAAAIPVDGGTTATGPADTDLDAYFGRR